MTLSAERIRQIAAGLPRGPRDARRIAGTERAVRRLLLGGVMPLWLGAGMADWYLHRRTHIEETAGPRESAMHALMFAETGVPVLIGLFCEVNAAVLASAYGAAAAHSATAFRDQAYAEERRRVSSVEQHVHSLLEVSPLTAALLLTALHWDQAAALAGHGQAPVRPAPAARPSPVIAGPRRAAGRRRRLRRAAVRRGALAVLARSSHRPPDARAPVPATATLRIAPGGQTAVAAAPDAVTRPGPTIDD